MNVWKKLLWRMPEGYLAQNRDNMRYIKKIDGSCAVCALQYVSGIDEETVLRVCVSCGFEKSKGMEDSEWMEAAKCLGVSVRAMNIEQPCALYQFIKNNPRGLYLVGTYDHIFVLDNSIIVDPRNMNPPGLKRRIKQAWKVGRVSV